MKLILIATNNNHKLKEYSEILSPLGYEVVSPRQLGISSDPEENGQTYRENSYIKAKALAELVDCPVISDDSGLEVEGLNFEPGIHSSRYAESFGGDYVKAGNTIIERLKDNPNKNAAFHCCICYLSSKDAAPLYFEGCCPGWILPEYRGNGGFGYDPIFHSEEADADFGLVEEDVKNKYSHRAKASAFLMEYLSNIDNDHIVRATAEFGLARAFGITSHHLAEEARELRNGSPIATAALGRLMSAGLMMGDMLKNDGDVLTLQINGTGPMKGLVVTSNNKGEVKGYVKVNDVVLPPNAAGHLNVGGAIGKGYLTVIRDYNMKEPYVSNIPLRTGEIAEDLTYYFATSEQTPSVVGLGVLMNKDNTVKRAGGFIVQLMPDCPEWVISQIEDNLKSIKAVTDYLDKDIGPEGLIAEVFKGLEVNWNGTKPVRWSCGCSKERSEEILLSLGSKELQELSSEGKPIDISCQFCGKSYHFECEEIENLYQESLKK